jgi:chaperonin GroES
MALKLKPLADRVIVKQTEAEEKTASGLYLPGQGKAHQGQGHRRRPWQAR